MDGKLAVAVGEERLNREKFTRAFPHKSIQEVMALTGVSGKDISSVVLASRITPNWISLRMPAFHAHESTNMFSPLLYWVVRQQIIFRNTGLIHLEAQMVKQYVKKQMKDFLIDAPIHCIDHHISHAYSAYSAAPFDGSLVVTMDAMGDGISCMTCLGDEGILKSVDEMNGFRTPAFIYSMVTQLLGFTPSRHEGKITGLAAYGDPKVLEAEFRQLMDYRDGRYQVRKMTNPSDPIFQRIMKHTQEDIAAGLQFVFEDIIVRYIKSQMDRHGRRKVAVAGGVFANVKLNQRIHEEARTESLFVFPNMGDGGLPVGGGFAFLRKKPTMIDSIYLGKEWSEKEIASALSAAGLKAEPRKKVENEVARLLAEGKVVGRFMGKMEYGPRALGNRSILAKADDISINHWLNNRLKRTEFMPFAPSTLMEHADRYYTGIGGARDTARHMTITFGCTEESKKSQPACVHVDNTARPQLVDKHDNPSYHAIISRYHEITGVASVLNTSFNVHEEPIVSSPDDAIKSFRQCKLDALAIGNFLVLGNG